MTKTYFNKDFFLRIWREINLEKNRNRIWISKDLSSIGIPNWKKWKIYYEILFSLGLMERCVAVFSTGGKKQILKGTRGYRLINHRNTLKNQVYDFYFG